MKLCGASANGEKPVSPALIEVTSAWGVGTAGVAAEAEGTAAGAVFLATGVAVVAAGLAEVWQAETRIASTITIIKLKILFIGNSFVGSLFWTRNTLEKDFKGCSSLGRVKSTDPTALKAYSTNSNRMGTSFIEPEVRILLLTI
jgi:hypothetical protein